MNIVHFTIYIFIKRVCTLSANAWRRRCANICAYFRVREREREWDVCSSSLAFNVLRFVYSISAAIQCTIFVMNQPYARICLVCMDGFRLERISMPVSITIIGQMWSDILLEIKTKHQQKDRKNQNQNKNPNMGKIRLFNNDCAINNFSIFKM